MLSVTSRKIPTIQLGSIFAARAARYTRARVGITLWSIQSVYTYTLKRNSLLQTPKSIEDRIKHVSETGFKHMLLRDKIIRPASLEDVYGTHHKRSLYRHPNTKQIYVQIGPRVKGE